MDNLADFAGLGHSADEGDQVLTLKFLPYKEEHPVYQAEARAKWLFLNAQRGLDRSILSE